MALIHKKNRYFSIIKQSRLGPEEYQKSAVSSSKTVPNFFPELSLVAVFDTCYQKTFLRASAGQKKAIFFNYILENSGFYFQIGVFFYIYFDLFYIFLSPHNKN